MNNPAEEYTWKVWKRDEACDPDLDLELKVFIVYNIVFVLGIILAIII